MDRLITIHVDYCDRDTEVAITAARSGVSESDAGRVVDLVRHFREVHVGRHRPSLRAAIMIARVVTQRGGTFDESDAVYQCTYRDVLGLNRDNSESKVTPRSHDSMNRDLAEAGELIETALQSV
jgi:nitric oxide reductase NorQ protein